MPVDQKLADVSVDRMRQPAGKHPGRTSRGSTATVPDKTKAAPAQAVPKGTIYTCPMHPQIRQVGPGNCPICGMTLEPVKATAEVGENRELIDMTRRFWVGLVLTLPVFVLEMGGHIPALGLHDFVPLLNSEMKSVKVRLSKPSLPDLQEARTFKLLEMGNRTRRHSSIGYNTPIQIELKAV